ncbi:hypothetical protein DH2020_042449 [Rehmannia glutinosa]|uniref:NADP-dependent oxidoreductase domain-containing protein n=1 Tax=Rehmannia glutinosa TaxID=99300 RepID=A0ABR0UPE5_REHGL
MDRVEIPEVVLNSGHKMPAIGLGTGGSSEPSAEQMIPLLLDAIAAGYRHIDTAALYGTEEFVGRAVAEAVDRGLVKSRDELFITSKLCCTDTHHDLVLPAIQESLRYFESLMINVELNVAWQQRKLVEFCKEKTIHVSAFSPLGAYGYFWGTHAVMDSPVLEDIAAAKNKTKAQVALRWIYEQGVSPIVRSFNKERMKENIQIFDWELTDEEVHKIEQQIPQNRACTGKEFVCPDGQYKSLEQLWDGEI